MRRGTKSSKAKVESKHPEAPTPPKSEGSRVRDLEERLAEALEELQTRNRELAESQEQQAATAEILRVISHSPTQLQPVLDAIATNAARVCGANDATVLLLEGGVMRRVAHDGPIDSAVLEVRTIDRDSVGGRAVLDREPVHVHDILAMAPMDLPWSFKSAQRAGFRTILAVPLLREGNAIGCVTIRRREVKPFSDKQVALLQTFADQAVIAIENVRLFKELEARNRDLTATSEILRVIASSPTDVQPVFNAIASSALRLCDGIASFVFRHDGTLIHLAAVDSIEGVDLEPLRHIFPAPPEQVTFVGRAVATGRLLYIADIEHDRDAPPSLVEFARANGFRSIVAAPMLRDGHTLGGIGVTHRNIDSFTSKQGALLETFANQAVIAIENVRLFTELHEKNQALTDAHAQVTESLEQQTATSEILRVIAASPTNVHPVLEAVAESVARLCDSPDVTIFRIDGSILQLAVHRGPIGSLPPYGEERVSLDRGTVAGRSAIERRTIHLADLSGETDEYPESSARARRFGNRAILSVPLLRDDEAIGAIVVRRTEARSFTERQVALLQTFADQAVIAIENARLFKELEVRTADLTRSVAQLTALGEVGRAVSSTLDLEAVLSTIVSRAVQLSGLDGGVVFEYDESAEEFVQRAMTNTGEALAEARRATRIRKGEGVLGRAAITLEPVQVADIAMPGAYEGRLREILIDSGIRAILAVPMVREGHLIGCLGVTRNGPGEFPAETIDLLRTFATQSALAIQNARLFREIEQKSRELEAASRHKSEFLANMSHELRTPLNAVIGFSEVLSERMFGDLNEKQDEYLQDIHASGQHLLSLINDILDLSKIEAGRMELEFSDFDLPMTIDNALMLIRERAARRSIALNTAVDERVGQVHADERKIRQVLLNLLSNAIKFTPEGGRIEVGAKPVNGFIEVSVSDTGVGIAPEDQEAVFEEFKQVGTADKKVEGTGLGLALSRKFIELHGGKIWLKSEVGAGATFTFTIPVRRDE